MVARCAAEGAAAFFALGFKGLSLGELGGNAQGLFLCFKVCGVEDVVVIVIFLYLLTGSRSGTRFEYLLGAHKAFAAARVGAGLFNLLSSHELAVAGFEVTTPE